jgi:hypothetical protein
MSWLIKISFLYAISFFIILGLVPFQGNNETLILKNFTWFYAKGLALSNTKIFENYRNVRFLFTDPLLSYHHTTSSYYILYSPYYRFNHCKYQKYLYEPMRLSLHREGWGVRLGFSF